MSYGNVPDGEQDDNAGQYPGYGQYSGDGPYPGNGQYPGYGQYQGSATPPPTYLPWAIATTLLCFIPAGIVSWVYAAQVARKWRTGDFQGAARASRRARNWAIASAVLALCGLVIILATRSSGTGG
jgi:hypothetical protein